MKCIICNSELNEKLIEYEEYGIPFGKYKAKVCSKCGEVYFDSETVDKIQQKSKKL